MTHAHHHRDGAAQHPRRPRTRQRASSPRRQAKAASGKEITRPSTTRSARRARWRLRQEPRRRPRSTSATCTTRRAGRTRPRPRSTSITDARPARPRPASSRAAPTPPTRPRATRSPSEIDQLHRRHQAGRQRDLRGTLRLRGHRDRHRALRRAPTTPTTATSGAPRAGDPATGIVREIGPGVSISDQRRRLATCSAAARPATAS